jgi:hypothetical protein
LKKTYSLNLEGKNRDRLLDAAKHDIRKYVKRERAKALIFGTLTASWGPVMRMLRLCTLAK